MRNYEKSTKLNNVCYDIRGPIMDEANRMAANGVNILKLNIGNPAPFRLFAPDEIVVDIIYNLRDTEGWTRVDSPLEAEDGKVKILLSVEGGEIFEGKVERVHEFYGYGVRMAALTWNNENEIGHSAKSGSKEGIKPVGWEILRAMAELKMAADTSHLNEAGFWDLIDKHSQPPMASHSCAMALCSHFRNLTDEQIRAMVKRGGWIGVNFYPSFLSPDGKASVSTICDHIDYMCQLGAEKNVGFGSDFDGIETTPVDCKSPADVPKILDELRRRGYSEEALADIAGNNFLNYYRRLGW